MTTEEPLIVIASNRGPFSFTAQDDGTFDVKRGAGGLVTAISALAEQQDVLWVACAMDEDDRKWADAQGGQATDVQGIDMRLISPDPETYRQYYNTISNPLLWFIQHELWDIPRSPSIDGETWAAWEEGYVEINKMFADALADSIGQTERPVIALIQDYHLYLVPQHLREQAGDEVQIQPFIHIPWPGPDAWRILPKKMRDAVLRSLLHSDRIGFQTERDAFNFVQTCRFYLDGAHSHGARDSIEYKGRKVMANAYPISIDVDKVEQLVQDQETRLNKSQVMNIIGDRALILRVDRIEPSKNILRGLEAYRILLENYPEHRGNVQMVALLVPSRMEVTQYQNYLRDIMAEAGMINAEFSDELWEPINIIVGDNYPRVLAAMELYDVLIVTSIADGMNLVAKEGALINKRDGMMLLSENAGAIYEMRDHVLEISPFDVYGMAESLNEALSMPRSEREKHAEALREVVRSNDVRQWFADQVEDARAALSSQSSSSSTSETPEVSASE